VVWAVLQPLMLVTLYWFVFTYMIPRGGSNPAENDRYIYFLIAGLIPWLGINEGLIRATTCIVDNGPMVRKLSFRSELLVIVPNASALIFECVALAIFLVFMTLRQGVPGMLWLLPLALLLQFGTQLGFALILAATYVFFRDLMQFIGFFLSIVFYLSPILYPVSAKYAALFAWNPLTPLLGLFRSALLSAPLPELRSIVFLLTFCSGTFVAGLLFFRRAEPGLVDLV
jgi:ABC-type polysaccharide/polyol phosphate export permease